MMLLGVGVGRGIKHCRDYSSESTKHRAALVHTKANVKLVASCLQVLTEDTKDNKGILNYLHQPSAARLHVCTTMPAPCPAFCTAAPHNWNDPKHGHHSATTTQCCPQRKSQWKPTMGVSLCPQPMQRIAHCNPKLLWAKRLHIYTPVSGCHKHTHHVYPPQAAMGVASNTASRS